MGFKKKKLSAEETNINLVPMIDITSFILLGLAILVMTMKKEASLDNILKLPPVLNAAKQDNGQLEIYILPAVVNAEGAPVNPDSTGLVAFAGKAKVPDQCPHCKAAFRNSEKMFITGSLLDISGKPVTTLQKSDEEKQKKTSGVEIPPAYLCAACKGEISAYVKLSDVPRMLAERKKEVAKEYEEGLNKARAKKGEGPVPKSEVDKWVNELPLMIKGDDKTYYGRILQVVNYARSPECDIRKFAFVTLPEASKEAQAKKDKKLFEEK